MKRRNFFAMILAAIPSVQVIKHIFKPNKPEHFTYWIDNEYTVGVDFAGTETLSVKDIEKCVTLLEKYKVPVPEYFVIKDNKPYVIYKNDDTWKPLAPLKDL